jgi:NTP pyrophosphatase (non-canonical NTP hydrolase)
VDLQELAASVERVSRRYASTVGIERTCDWQIPKSQEEVGELTQAHLMRKDRPDRRDTPPAELDEKLTDEIADGSATRYCSPSTTRSISPQRSRGSG